MRRRLFMISAIRFAEIPIAFELVLREPVFGWKFLLEHFAGRDRRKFILLNAFLMIVDDSDLISVTGISLFRRPFLNKGE